MTKKAGGWFGESKRHSLASRGISTWQKGNLPHYPKIDTGKAKKPYTAKRIHGNTPRTNRLDQALELGFQSCRYEAMGRDMWLVDMATDYDNGEDSPDAKHAYILKEMHKLIKEDPSQERELWEFLVYGWQFGSQHYGPSVEVFQKADKEGAIIAWPTKTTDRERQIIADDLKYHHVTLDWLVDNLSGMYHAKYG